MVVVAEADLDHHPLHHKQVSHFLMSHISKRTKKQRGFTLLEAISVLVLLAILSAIATPMYMSIVDKSKNTYAEAIVSEAIARLNDIAAKLTIKTGKTPLASEVSSDLKAQADYENAGDFQLVIGNGDNVNGTVAITVNGISGTATGALATGVWSIYLPTPVTSPPSIEPPLPP